MGARAIIDAATLWGSERIINRRHDDPSWPWRGAHVVYDDQTMFLDFLHSLILYEEIIMDNSSLYRLDGSLSTLSEEIFAFLHYINELADFEIIKDKSLARFDTPMSGLNEGWEDFRRKADRVAGDVCDLVRRKIPPSDAPTFYVPWAYRSARHADHEMFEKAAANTRLDPVLLPLAKFAFRGLYYADIANHAAGDLGLKVFGSTTSLPVAYAAAPNRLSVIKAICLSSDVTRIEAHQAALMRIREVLPGVAANGYNFSSIESLSPVTNSPLLSLVDWDNPKAAISQALAIRQQSNGAELRKEWADLLFSTNENEGLVGSTEQSQSMSNVTALFVKQIIIGKPASGRRPSNSGTRHQTGEERSPHKRMPAQRSIRTEQIVEDSVVRSGISQMSPGGNMRVSRVNAASLTQSIGRANTYLPMGKPLLIGVAIIVVIVLALVVF